MAVSKSHVIKISQPDELTLLPIRSDECRKSRERAHLANTGEFNCPISDMPDIRQSQRSAKIAIAAPSTPGDF